MTGIRTYALMALAALTVLSSVPAKASILLEPYLGYELGKHDSPASNSSFDFSSAVLGARLAYEFPVVFVGVDYMTPLGGTAKQTSGGSTSYDVTGSALYAEVGFQLPLIRGYLGYGLLHDETFKNGASTKFDGGTAVKVGIGTTILPAVAINLEYLNSTYEKANGNTLSSNDKDNYYMLSVSLPFSL